MSLDSQVVAARIHLRVRELRLLAAVTAVQLARGKTSSRPAPRPVASPAIAAWRYPSPPAATRISLLSRRARAATGSVPVCLPVFRPDRSGPA